MAAALFNQIRPHCVSLMQSLNHKDDRTRSSPARQLFEIISTAESTSIPPNAPYLLIPLELALGEGPGPRTPCESIEHILQCLAVVLEHTTFNQASLTNLWLHIAPWLDLDSSGVGSVEETLDGSVKCMQSLIRSNVAHDCLIHKSFQPALGFVISKLLDIASQSLPRSLRSSALATIQQTCVVVADSQILISIMPGIISRVSNLAVTSGESVPCEALTILSTILPLALVQQECGTDSDSKRLRDAVSVVKRDPDLIATKLHPFLEKVFQPSMPSHWRVRLHQVQAAKAILTGCSHRLLQSTIATLAECLISRVEDPIDTVSAAALSSVSCIPSSVSDNGLHRTCTALPRIMRAADDGVKLAHLSMIRGYIRLCTPDVILLGGDGSVATRLISSFVDACEMTAVVPVIQRIQADSVSRVALGHHPNDLIPFPKHYHNHFSDGPVYKSLTATAQMLGKTCSHSLLLLIDKLLGQARQPFHPKCRESLFVLSEVVLGACEDDCQELALDVALDGLVSVLNESPSVGVACLVLEAIGSVATAFGAKMVLRLPTCLFTVVAQLGDDRVVVSRSALASLQRISFACGYVDTGAIATLLLKNADYLVDDAVKALRHPGLDTTAARVLEGVLAQTGCAVLASMSEVIDAAFQALEQPAEDQHTSDCLRVLAAVTNAISRESKRSEKKQSQPTETLSSYFKQLADRINRATEPRLPSGEGAARMAKHAEREQMQEDEEEEEEKEKKLPSEVETVKRVLEVVRHFAGGTDQRRQIHVLRIIADGFPVVSPYTETCLPLAATVWPALLPRLHHDDPVIKKFAWQALISAVAACGDFLRQRVMDEAWSAANDPQSLHSMTAIIPHLKLSQSQALAIASKVGSIACTSRKDSSENAFALLECLSVSHPDVVWMEALRICGGPEILANPNGFPLRLDIPKAHAVNQAEWDVVAACKGLMGRI